MENLRTIPKTVAFAAVSAFALSIASPVAAIEHPQSPTPQKHSLADMRQPNGDPESDPAGATATQLALNNLYGEGEVSPELLSADASELDLVPRAGLSGQEFTVTAPESGFEEVGGDLVAQTNNGLEGVATYSHAIDGGVAIVTTVNSPRAAQNFEYEISGVEDPYLVELGDNSYVMLDGRDVYIASIGEPWAVDANGVDLVTHYTLTDNILTQHIDYSDVTEYPVVADPAWTYRFDIRSYTLITGKEKATPARVMKELRRCFNCSFPVTGAPHAFPVYGQTINLDASPFTFIKKPAPVKVSDVNSTGFQFVAKKGHFDGEGSTITFNFYNDASGWLHLTTRAIVVKGGSLTSVNKAFAEQKWHDFLARLIRQRTL